MVQCRSIIVALSASALCVATIATLTETFLLPGSGRSGLSQHVGRAGSTQHVDSSGQGGNGRFPWGAAASGLALGAHIGLFCARRRGGRSVVNAAETAAEQ